MCNEDNSKTDVESVSASELNFMTDDGVKLSQKTTDNMT